MDLSKSIEEVLEHLRQAPVGAQPDEASGDIRTLAEEVERAGNGLVPRRCRPAKTQASSGSIVAFGNGLLPRRAR